MLNLEELRKINLTRPRGGPDFELLKRVALQVRRDVVTMLAEAGSGHPGGSLSCADVVAALYVHYMRHDPARPDWPERDRFVLSKGHCCPTLYSILSLCGYFDRQELLRLRKLGSILQGHPDSKRCPGVEISSGSLGQGLSAALGMALAARTDGRSYRVFAMIGDGESEEGQIWEASMAAAHYKVNNLIAILDNNDLQIDGPVREVMNPHPLPDKWRAFGWRVIGPTDGHDFQSICAALDEALTPGARPTICIFRTIKGKGVSFMENQVEWHGKAPDRAQLAQALADLGEP
jgi:transketolase